MVSFSSEQLTGQKFTTVGVTQSAILQRTKLKTLLDKVDKLLGYSSDSPESVCADIGLLLAQFSLMSL